MTKEIKGLLVGIGGGSKVHLSTAIVFGDKMSVQESHCGSVKTSGWSKSNTYGLKLSEQSFPYLENSAEYGSESYWATRNQNINSIFAARAFMAYDLLATDNACSKCVKTATYLINKLEEVAA